jgi:hypothetical protein
MAASPWYFRGRRICSLTRNTKKLGLVSYYLVWGYIKSLQAQVAELADALDSGSSVRKGRGGSNPLLGTMI